MHDVVDHHRAKVDRCVDAASGKSYALILAISEAPAAFLPLGFTSNFKPHLLLLLGSDPLDPRFCCKRWGCFDTSCKNKRRSSQISSKLNARRWPRHIMALMGHPTSSIAPWHHAHPDLLASARSTSGAITPSKTAAIIPSYHGRGTGEGCAEARTNQR